MRAKTKRSKASCLSEKYKTNKKTCRSKISSTKVENNLTPNCKKIQLIWLAQNHYSANASLQYTTTTTTICVFEQTN